MAYSHFYKVNDERSGFSVIPWKPPALRVGAKRKSRHKRGQSETDLSADIMVDITLSGWNPERLFLRVG